MILTLQPTFPYGKQKNQNLKEHQAKKILSAATYSFLED